MVLDQVLKRRFFKEKNGKDSNIKSLMKSVSWRVVGTFDTMIISYLVTGQVKMAISIGSVEVFSKIILYYLHERVWERAGKNKNNETESSFA
jgi:uncharacterized membrane protein